MKLKYILFYIIQIKNLTETLSNSKSKVIELTNTLSYLISDIEKLVTAVDPARWKNGLIKLYDKYLLFI